MPIFTYYMKDEIIAEFCKMSPGVCKFNKAKSFITLRNFSPTLSGDQCRNKTIGMYLKLYIYALYMHCHCTSLYFPWHKISSTELSSLPDLCSLSDEDGDGDLLLRFPAGCEATCSASSNLVPECGERRAEGRVTTNVIYFILR